jgi:hypothetical protein
MNHSLLLRIVLLLVGLMCASSAWAQAPLPVVRLTADDIDYEASAIKLGEEQVPVDPGALRAVMGITTPAWIQAPIPDARRGEPVEITIVLKRPVEVGSVLVVGYGRKVSIRTNGAWTDLQSPSPQSAGGLYPLPPGTKLDAVRMIDEEKRAWTRLEAVRLFEPRLLNVAPIASAFGDDEYIQYSVFGPPYTYYAWRPIRGGGAWQNAGKDEKGNIRRAPVSDVFPGSYILAWREEQTISGLFVRGNLLDYDIRQFIGGPEISPRAGTEKEWKKVRDFARIDAPMGTWIWFKEPIKVRGIELRITRVSGEFDQIARIEAMHAYTDLKQADVPAMVITEGPTPPPVRIPIEIDADDATVTIAIDRQDGTRVRNLVSRARYARGQHEVGWDLKDESGQVVPSGTYTWKMIYHPPLELRYEMTPYPNVGDIAPENAPWLTTKEGPNGWLADHTPNKVIATTGDRMFIGSPVVESGVSLIETDLNGKKLWGRWSFAGFTGVSHLAVDELGIYAAASASMFAGERRLDPRTEIVWVVDQKDREMREAAVLSPSATRDRGIQGMAAREGKVYISVRGAATEMSNAMGADDFDIEQCYPKYPPRRQPKYHNEIVPDPRADFIRLFRVQGTPPGDGLGLDRLESTEGRSSRQYIVAAFKREVPIGSVVLPKPTDPKLRVQLSVLKPDAPYPPDPSRQEDWIKFDRDPSLPWDVVTAPKELRTRALRITFLKGEEDLFTEILEGDSELRADSSRDEGIGGRDTENVLGDSGNWKGELEGVKLLRRRFENLSAGAKVVVSSGQIGEDGVWDAKRKEPLTEDNPAVYSMQWEKPVKVRGLAIKEIDGKLTRIDVWTGPDGAPIDLKSKEHWKEIATYEQPRRYFTWQASNARARFMDGYVDFGQEVSTRAVRLRVVQQWIDNGENDLYADRVDRFAHKIDPARCHIYGVAALGYVGGEVPVDPLIAERIEVLDVASGQIVQEVAVPQPGDVAIGPDGRVLAISNKHVVEVKFDGSGPSVLVSDLVEPGPLAIDREGKIYVYDGAADRRNIRVYDPAGKYLRSVGEPGGYEEGPWNPNRLDFITDIAVDSQLQVWAVSFSYWPKRVAVFAADGSFVREMIGPTQYGGGGVLDPWDRSRLLFGPLEFKLDWETGRTKLAALNMVGNAQWQAGELPIRIDGRDYLVTRPGPPDPQHPCGVVYLKKDGHTRLVAAVGMASAFHAFKDPAVHAQIGFVNLKEHRFIFCDRNGDGQVQADEVQLTKGKIPPLGKFSRDLGIQGANIRYEVKEFLPNGAPVYVENTNFSIANAEHYNWYMLDNGLLHARKSLGNKGPEFAAKPDGTKVWTYAVEQPGTHGYAMGGPFHPGQVLGHFMIVGHETAPKGDLGEFFVYSSNTGAWHIFTADGLLAGQIFHDLRERGAQSWTFPQHDRGMNLGRLTIGQEHFGGYMGRSFEDDKFYAVAGHNHASVVEIVGLDRFKRKQGEVSISDASIAETIAWERETQQRKMFERAPLVEAYRMQMPKLDGSLNEWGQPAARITGFDENDVIAAFYVGFDNEHLYFAYRTFNLGPMKNSGEQLDRLFKSGAAVDMQLGLNPDAPADRKAPVEGDIRLLMSVVKGKPVGVLYRAVVPGTPPDKTWQVVSPVGRATFDEVRVIDPLLMKVVEDDYGYVAEGAVPLSTLGLKITDGLRIKFDWGMLVTDASGNQVNQRIYWANKATAIVADAPSEAVLTPHLWGHMIFRNRARDVAAQQASDQELGRESDSDDATDDIFKDFMEEVGDDVK